VAVKHNLTGKALEDYKLIQLALKGDKRVFEKLVTKYKAPLQYMAFYKLRSEHDAEDVVMMSFTKAFKKLHQYKPEFAFSTWLFRITSNNCIDFLRKKKERTISIDNNLKNSEGREMAFNIKSGNLSPEEKMIREQRISLLHEIVENLKPKYRELIEMRFFQEYSYDEMAEQLNLPLGTVKAQLHRAKMFLQITLKGAHALR
jgi:RNA polymerase sigma-70 factor (ECF subfamily)